MDASHDPPDARRVDRFAVLALGLGVVALLAAAASGFGHRAGLWHFSTGFTILRYAAFGGAAAAGLGLVGLVRTRPGGPTSGFAVALLAVLLGAAAAYVPWSWWRAAKTVPPIHDITTDLDDPPGFVDVLPLREDAPNPAAYGGPEVAALQRAGYPDLGPLVLGVPPADAFDRAVEAAEGLGWEIVAVEPTEGRIEATDTTLWYGFVDDVVVRVEPTDGGSRIDARSVSRVGRSDVGTNARRIRAFLAAVARG